MSGEIGTRAGSGTAATTSYHRSAEDDREHFGPLPVDQRFPIASITKTLTALLVARLAVDGELTWSGAPEIARQSSWRTLLNHTAGLPLELHPDHWHTSALSDADVCSLAVQSARLPLPPATWHYSNLAYGLVARGLEQQLDRSYSDLLSAYVLQPLGMGATSLPRPAEPPGILGAAAAAGDLRSTLEDLMTLGRALAGERPDVVSWPMLELLLDAGVPNGRGELLGAGLRTFRIGRHTVLVSSGTILEHTSCLVIWPRRGVSVVVAEGAADHAVLRDGALERWRRDVRKRRWWLDGQEVLELSHRGQVELVLEETAWPYPIFAGRRDGSSLSGVDWRGRPMTLVSNGGVLSGGGLRLTAHVGDSAWSEGLCQ